MRSPKDLFNTLGPREQAGLRAAAGGLALVLLIGVGVWPAVRSLRANPQAQQQAQAQLQTLRGLQLRAQNLLAQPPLDPAEALVRLQASAGLLGVNTEFRVVDQRVNVVLHSTPAKALADWLARARTDAYAVPTEARLTRENSEVQADEALWSGTLVMALPPPL